MQKINITLIHGWGFSDSFWLPLVRLLKKNRKYKFCFNLYNLGFFGKKKIFNTSKKNCLNLIITHSYGYCWYLKNEFECDGIVSFFYPGNFFFLRQTNRSKLIVNMINEFKNKPCSVLKKFYKLCGNLNFDYRENINSSELLNALIELKEIDFNKIKKTSYPIRLSVYSQNDKVIDRVNDNDENGKKILILKDGSHVLPLTDPDFSSKIILKFIENDIQKKSY